MYSIINLPFIYIRIYFRLGINRYTYSNVVSTFFLKNFRYHYTSLEKLNIPVAAEELAADPVQEDQGIQGAKELADSSVNC